MSPRNRFKKKFLFTVFFICLVEEVCTTKCRDQKISCWNRSSSAIRALGVKLRLLGVLAEVFTC